MFFSITTSSKFNFSNHLKLGQINLYIDQGWKSKNCNGYTLVYKGYADDFSLGDNLLLVLEQDIPAFTGNFCVICYEHCSGKIFIKTDLYRSFPIFIHDQEITNLIKSEKVAWSDSIVCTDQNFSIDERKFDLIGKIQIDQISVEDAVKSITDTLLDKTAKFLSHNHLPIKVHLSGGVDSLLVYALLKNKTNEFEIVRSRHFDYDKFWLLNDTQITTQFWGYTQIHHWNDACILISGAPGDEFMLRSPSTIDMFLKYKKQSTLEILKNKQQSLHGDYFQQEKHIKIFQNQIVDQNLSVQDFYWNLCNIVVNDWQHWHIGNTLTWTPLRDLEIFKTLLRISCDDAIDQIFDSKISIKLIEQCVPGLSQLISDQKNSKNPMKNLIDFLFDNFE